MVVLSRDKSGCLSREQIIEVLDAVNCECGLDDKLNLLSQLHKLVHNNPIMCERFFVPPAYSTYQHSAGIPSASSYTAWSAATKIIEQIDEADPAGGKVIKNVLVILCTVHSQVGIGVDNLRGLLEMMIRGGCWAPFSLCLLDALRTMVLSEAAKVDENTLSPVDDTNAGLFSNTALKGGKATSETTTRRNKVFVLDGQSGLFLGSFSAWPFDAGYAFETWVWPDDSAHGSAQVLLRVIVGEEDPDESRAPSRDALAPAAVVEILLHAETIIIITSQAGSKRSPLKCHAAIPSRQGTHIAFSHRKGGLLSRAECDLCVNGHFSSYVLPFPKPSHSGDAAVTMLVGCAQMDPSVQPPHLFWEKSSVSLQPFKGLMSTVRFYTSPLTVNDMRALYAASCSGLAPSDLSQEARLLAQPHIAFPSLPVRPAEHSLAGIGDISRRMQLCVCRNPAGV